MDTESIFGPTPTLPEARDDKNNFSIDFSKNGRAKCKKCKKNIPKGDLRIGKCVPFKAIFITQYYHPNFAFESFQKSWVSTNAITSMDEIDNFELINDDDKS